MRTVMALLAWLRKAQAALHQCAESIRKTEQRKRNREMERDTEPIRVQAVVTFDEKRLSDEQAENDRNHATQESIKRATWAAFYAVAIYATVTACMWFSMRSQTKLLAKQINDFEAFERASLVLSFEADWPDQNGPIQVHCTISNAGQTVALGMAISTGTGGGGKILVDKNGVRSFAPIYVPATPNPSEYGPSLGQNKERDCSWTYQFPQGDRAYVDGVRVGDIVHAFTVSVSYKDVFGRPWIVNDCLEYWVKYRGSGQGRFAHCPM